jgi:hypothetical protein
LTDTRQFADSSSINTVSFHPHAQRNAFRRRDARQQSGLFVPHNPSLQRSPKLEAAFLRLSAMISQYFTQAGFCLFCSPHRNDKVTCELSQ